MTGIKYQIRKNMVFIAFILAYVGLSACSDKEVVETESIDSKNLSFVLNDDFFLLKEQTSALENEIAKVNQEIVNLKDSSSQFDKEIADIEKQLSDLNDSDKASDITIKEIIARLNDSESKIESIENKIKQKKLSKTTKRKKLKPRFNYSLVDVSQWGSRILVSVKIDRDFIFLSEGDVIGVWRLENANIQTRKVIFKHNSTQKTISRVIL